MPPAPARLAFSVWALAAAFYLFGFFQRVTPASLSADLMRDFGLTAAGLGNLAAFYYYAYAAVQIPAGMTADRWGPRRLLTVGSALAAVGALLFALAHTTWLAGLGRALIGAAHGLAWVSMMKLLAHWFPPARFGTLAGLSLAVGTAGAVLAGPPLRWLADGFGWRAVIGASGVLALLLALAIRRWVRDDPADAGHASHAPGARVGEVRHASLLRSLIEVCGYRNTWLLLVANSGVCGGFLTFTGLWGVPFFVQHHGLSIAQAATITSAMLVLFAVGGPLAGMLSDRWRRRRRPFAIGTAMVVTGFGLLALWPAAPLQILVPALLFAGLGAGSMAISFGHAKESVPLRLQGTVTGVVNAGVMLGTLTQMPLIGLILDAHWEGVIVSGVRQYGLGAFQIAFGVLAAWVTIAFVLLLLTRETHARQLAE
jgi:sugar phosphate permease